MYCSAIEIRRKRTRSSVALLTLCGVLFLWGSPSQAAVQLISNGDFETGTLAGWTKADLAGSSGTFFLQGIGATSPSSGSFVVGPKSGAFYALSDQQGAGTHVLYQDFSIPLDKISAILSFDMFVNSYDSVVVNPGGLNHNLSPNQHARVDILTGSADPFSTAAGDVVQNLFLGADAGTNPHDYSSHSVDLLASGLVPDTPYRLRFAQVDNAAFLNMGIDNVSILADTAIAAVPEPASLALWALPLGMLLFAVRRRSARR